MEIECDLASIRDEDLLRKMWQQSEDFGRKKEIRSHLYKLRESRLREFYSAAGPGGDIMNPATDLCFGKTPLTPSHGDSLVDQSFQSLKSKEVRDSESPTREIKFRNSGGVAGGVLVPDTTGWNVQTSSEVSPDGRAFRTETLAKTDGVEKIPGGRAEFAGRNEQKSSASHQGDDKNFVKKAAESSKTHLQEKIVIGDENSGRTEMKSSSVTSSSSKVVSSSSQVISSGDPVFDMEPRRLTQDQQYEKVLSAANTSALRSEQQQYQRNERNERNETSSNLREESRKYVDMDKTSPEYQQHVQYLMSQPGAIVSNIVEYPKPGVKMITTVKQLPDGTTVKTKRYETDAAADTGSVSQTIKQQQQQRMSSSTTQKTTEKRIQDSEDVFTRLARTRDSSGPVSPRKTSETPSQDDIYSRLQKSRGEQKFSDTIDQRSTQILRDGNQHPTRRPSDLVDNVEVITSTNKTVKKDLNQSTRNEKITSADFLQTERDRFVLDRDSPSRRGPDGFPEALAPITPSRYSHPQPDDTPSNGYPSTGVIQQSSKSSAKFSESRRFSTETVESYQHSESHNESQDFTTHGFPSVRRPSEEPKVRSPSSGRPGQDFSTHGFPSVRSDKPTQEYPSERPSTHEKYNTTERVHIVSGDRQRPGDAYPQSPDSTSTTRANFSSSETRRHVTSSTDDFSTHGFPSVRPGTPTRDSPRRPLGSDPSPGESPKRPQGQEAPASHIRRPPSDGFSTHGFPSVKTGSPTDDSPRRPSGPEPTNQGRRPTTEDFSTHGFPSVKPGRTTPTQSAPQYEDTHRTPNRRLPSVDRDDTISVSSDRSNSVIYEKRIDAAHQAFARSLRCASPVDTVRRDSISDRQTPRTSVSSIRNSYSPSKRDGRSPSHESITNSESSRISSGTVTKSHRPTTTETRRVSGPKSPLGKTAPTHESPDSTLTRKITPKPTDKPAGRPSPVKEKSNSAEPILRKKIFAATEGFLASEGVAEEPILKKEQYYQLGPSDATLPSSRLKSRQLLGTTPNSRRATNYNTEEEVNTLLDTATKHTTPLTTRSAKIQDTKPPKPDTLYSNKPKTKPEGYVSINRANEITEKHNQTTNKQVSYPHYIPSAPKADRSSQHPERPQTSLSDKPTKNLSSPAPTTTSTTPHNAPKSATDKPKVSPITSPTPKPSSSPSRVDNNTTRFTKTVKVDNAITRDTTKTRREPESERLPEPEDVDEGYVPDKKGHKGPQSKRPTSDDEGFEPDSPRAGSPTSDFEYRRPTQTETFDEEDSISKRTRKTDKKTVIDEFLDTERGVKTSRRPEDNGPSRPRDAEPKEPGVKESLVLKEPRRPEEDNRKPSYTTNEPSRPEDDEPNRPSGVSPSQPRRPEDDDRKPSYLIDEPNRQSGISPSQLQRPEENVRKPSYLIGEPNSSPGVSPSQPRRPEDDDRKPSYLIDEPNRPSGVSPRQPRRPEEDDRKPSGLIDEPNRSSGVSPSQPRYPEEDEPKPSYLIDEPNKPSDVNPSQSRRPEEDDRKPSYLANAPREPTGHRVKEEGHPEDKSKEPSEPSRPSDLTKTRGTKPPLDRSETFEERCRHILGMEIETTIERAKKVQDFIDTERVTVDVRRKPTERLPSPQKKQPSDSVSIEDCDDDDTDKITTTTRTTKTTVEEYPRGRSPAEKLVGQGPRDRSPSDKVPKGTGRNEFDETTTVTTTTTHPRDGSPLRESPKGTRPTEIDETRPRDRSLSSEKPRSVDETTVRKTTIRGTTIIDEIDDRAPSTRLIDGSPLSKTRPTEIDETTVRETTTTTKIRDDRTPSTRPRDESPLSKVPRGTSPREKSPSKKPTRGSSPTNKTIVSRITTTTATGSIDDRYLPSRPKNYPRDHVPSEKPREELPEVNILTVQTTRTTKDTTAQEIVDDVFETCSPRNRFPTDKPREVSPTDDTTNKRTSTTTRDTMKFGSTTSYPTEHPRDRYPIEKPEGDRSPRDQSPSEKTKRGPRPTNIDETTTETITTWDQTVRQRDRSPTEKPIRSPRIITTPITTEFGIEDRPRSQSPTDKSRRPKLVNSEEIDETYVQRTTKSTQDTTTVDELDVDNRSPKPNRRPPPMESDDLLDQPRSGEWSPKLRPTDRSLSPRSKPRDKYTSGSRPTNEDTRPCDRSPTERKPGSPRRSSPSEKPRRRQPTDEEIDVTVVQKTTKTTRDRTTLEEVSDRSPKDRYPEDRPRDRSPTEKPRTTVGDRSPKDHPRGISPTEKPRRRQPTGEETDVTVVQKTTKTTRDSTTLEEVSDRSPKDRYPEDRPRDRSPTEKPRTTVGDRSPKDHPRGISPTEKPRRRQPTDEEIDVTVVQKTTKTTRDRTTLEEVSDRSPKDRYPEDRPRDRSPTEKPRTTVGDRSPKDHPRGTSPTEKSRRRQPTDEEIDVTVVQKTTKTTRDRTTLEEVSDRSPKDRYPEDRPRDRSPTEKPRTTVGDHSPKDHPRGTSPTEKPRRRQPTDEEIDVTVVQKTTKTTRDRTTLEEVSDRSPKDRYPEDRPRDRSPTEKPRTTVGDRSPKDHPRGTSPTEKPRRRQPSDEEIDVTVVQKTTKTTRDRTTLEEVSDRSPKDRYPEDRPRDRSPTEKTRTTVGDRSPKDHPRGISPTEKPRRRQPTDEEIDVTVVQKTTKTTRDRTTLEEVSDRSPKDRYPEDRPRDRSPTEKPRTTVGDRSPKDHPRGTSPTEKSRRRQPTDEEIDVTVVQKTTKTTRDRTTLEEVSDRSPKDRYPEDRPRDRSPTEKPRTTVGDRSPKDHPRGTSPTEKPRRRQPTDEEIDVTVVQKTTKTTRDRTTLEEIADRSPKDEYPKSRPRGSSPSEKPHTTVGDRSPKDHPRGTSPTEKPRRRQPTDEEIDVTVVQKTTKTTRDRTTLEEVSDRSPKDRYPEDRPRDRSPTEKPRTTVGDRSPKDHPRGTSPTEKPRRRQPTDEEIDVTVVQKTTKTTRDRTTLEEVSDRSPKDRYPEDRPRDRSPTEKPRTTVGDRSPKDHPRGISPTEKPRRRQPTGEETDVTVVQKTTKTTRDSTTLEEVSDRSPKDRYPEDRPRDRSPTEKPRTTVGDRSPKDHPRGTSPTEKPRRRQPTDEEIDVTVVQKTTKTIRDTTTLEEVSDRSPKDRYPEDRPRDRSPTEKPRTTVGDRSPKDHPRGTSPTEKPRRRQPTDEEIDVTVVQKTTKTTRDRTTLEEVSDRSPKDRYPEDRPRDRSPTEKPRTTVGDRSPKDHPRGTSPTEKPRRRQPTDEEIDVTVVQKTTKTIRDTTTLEEIADRSPKDEYPKSRPRGSSPSEKPSSRSYPRDGSPYEKPRGPKTTDDTLVQRTVKKITDRTVIDDKSSKGYPRRTSPSQKSSPKVSPRDISPIEKPRGLRPTAEQVVERTVKTITDRTSVNVRPRDISPSEKPKKRQPTAEETEETIVQKTSQTTKDRNTLEEIDAEYWSPQDRPRGASPSEKPRRRRPSEEDTDDTVEDRPRDTSPSEKPRKYLPTGEVIEETLLQKTSKTTRDRTTLGEIEIKRRPSSPRDRSPTEKPRAPRPSGETIVESDHPRQTLQSDKSQPRHPTDVGFEETIVQRTSKITKDRSTLEKISAEDLPRDKSPSRKLRGPIPKDESEVPRGTSPSERPRGRQPADEEIDVTVVQKTSKTIKDRTTLIETEDRPRGQSPSEKPSFRVYPRDTSPTDETTVRTTIKTTRDQTFEDRYPEHRPEEPRDRSPSEKPRGPGPIDETVFHRTVKIRTIEDRPSELEKDLPSDEEICVPRATSTKVHPRDSSPSHKPRSSRPSGVTESTTTRTTLQETDFEKRYPKGRPRHQSPVETRRPSKPNTTTTTTTTRNRSTLEENDVTGSPRPKAQPSTRDKLLIKSTPSPRAHPTIERRIPADIPSPSRKPKSTYGTTIKTTTQTTVTKVPAIRPKQIKEVPKKPTKLVSAHIEPRPSARQPERRHSPSISPDSSPSRPTSEVELESPQRSPYTSPSRKSPSPTRSVKLEDITSSVVTTKKTTVSIDKSKPKVTHVTTAKFQVSPPTSPTKVISAPEIKSSPSRKPMGKAPIPKPTASRLTTTKKVTSTTVRKDVVIPTDSERDSEVPTDVDDVDSPLSRKTPTRKLPVTERKESAPVHRVTQVDKDLQKMSRSTSENIIKTAVLKRPAKHEPLEPIVQREATKPTPAKTSPKTERRPSKHLSTKTINLTTFDKVINSQDMENVVIDIQQAKSSREPSPNKIVPTPVAVDVYTGKPRYPDVVQEPEDEPRKKPNVKNIPIFEEETNDFVGCQITEVSEESFENTNKVRTMKFIEGESRPQRPTPTIVTGDNVDNECMLSVHDKVSKFISTAEEVSKPKTSAPFRRDVPEENVPEDDECLLTVDEKVNKFMKTAESVTREVITSTPKPIERPRIDDLDEDLKTDECVLSVSEKVNKFTTKAEKLAPSTPQRSPELVARIERQISKQSDVEPESPRDTRRYPESPEDDDSPITVRKVKQAKSLFERDEKKYTERQIDILSRPSVWDKKPRSDIKLDDILGHRPEDEAEPVDSAPRRKSPVKDQPDVAFSKPSKPITDTVSKKKEIFENKISTRKTTTNTKPGFKSPERSATQKQPSDESDSRYPSEFTPRYVDGYPQEPDDVHEDVYGSLKTRRSHETSSLSTSTIRHSPERSPTRKSSHPEIRPLTQTSTSTPRQPKQPGDYSPSRRYSDDQSPRHPSKDERQTDLYMETCETSEYTTRRRSSTQKYPEDHSPDRRTPQYKSPSPSRKQPVEEPEDYTFSSTREETNKHHTTRTSYRGTKDTPLNETSFPDDEDHDHSPARSTSTISSQKRTTSHRTTSNRLTEDTTSRRPRRPSGNDPSTPRGLRPKAVPETVAARRNIFEKSPGDVSPRPGHRRPSYMDHTKSSLEHTRKDSIEITKTNYSRKSSMEDEPYESSPRSAVKFGVGLKHKEEPKPRRKLSSSDIPNVEDVFELELLEEMLNIVTSYEQRRRIRAQIRVVKKLLETKTKEEVSKMTKITTFRKTSSSSVRDSPIPRRDTPIRPDRYQPSDDIDSESIVESSHIEEREEIIRERSISPQTKISKTVTKVTEVRKIGEPLTPKRVVPKKEEPKDSKPIWATKNILKKPSENEKVARALSAKKTTSTSSSSTSRTQQTHRQRIAADEDCITSSYGIGPTDEDGRPLFGIRALKKKTTTTKTAQPSETTKVTGTVITEKYYSENGAEPVGERKVTVYSSNPEDLLAMETQCDRRDSETVKRERLSKDGLTSVTKVQKIGKYKPGEVPAITDDIEFAKTTSKTVRRGSVKEMSEKFIRKESSSSVTEKSSGYPKAGLILRTRTNSGATADAADQYEVRAKSTEYDDESDNECDVEIRTSRKHSKVVTESEDETEIRRKVNTRSFLNSAGSKVTGVDDVLDRMRNADNVVVDGDTLEDREARALLNKFLGASVLMTGMESIIPQKELKKTTAAADSLKKQEVKTTRVTKTTKSAATGGSSSSPVARETCDFEEIWDEEILKELLDKSTSYEERRSIRARLRQLMAEREACAELVASVKAELDNDTNVKTSSADDTKVVEQQKQLEDESSCSEYEEIIEEYTASEDEEEETKKVVIADKKEEVKEETKKITEDIQKTIITKKEEPKQTETKETIVVEKTTVIEKDATPSSVEQKKPETKADKEDDDNETSVSDNSKGESLLIPLLQGLLHKNMPQARSSSSTSKTATTATTTSTAYQNSNNLKSSLKSNNTHFSSTSSNNNNSLGDSGLSSEVSKNSSLGQGDSSLRVTAQQIEDSGTESGEDLRLIAAGIRDSMQIEGIENQSDMSLIKEVTNALNRLESSLKEGKDLALDSSKKNTLLALVERLQTGLTAPDKLSSNVGEQNDETSSPEADNHRSNRQRFAKRRNRNNRHTVGVSKEELADARRYMEDMVMIENLSNRTTPECNAVTTPPQFFAIQKQHSTGAILSSHDSQETSSNLFRPNQFVPSSLKHSTEAGSAHPDVQLRQKKGTPGPGQRQSVGDVDYMKVGNPDSSSGKRPLSDSYDSYSAQTNRVTFSDSNQQSETFVQEKNQYNRSHHSDNQPDVTHRTSPDSMRFNRFNNKKQLMKRANTIDIPKTHAYNPEFDTDSDFEDRSTFNVKGLRGTVQVSVKRKPRQVVPNFEPKTENDHKFLAFIQKQNTAPGLGWNSSKSVSNWTNKFGSIKNVFESGTAATSNNRLKVSASPASSAKNFWKKAEERNPPKVSTSVLTSALKAKERNEQMSEVVVPKPIHINKFIHNPQSAFRPIDTSPETIQMQFKPIPVEKPLNVVNNFSPTKAYNPVSSRKPVLESPQYASSSPTKSWVKKNTATNSPVTLPWAVKPPENSVLKMAATKFESKSPLNAVQRHQSFKQQEAQKRPSLPNAEQPYPYQDDGYSQPRYMSHSQPASYADYAPQIVTRQDSLTNPEAEPLVLTPNKPAYSPHSLQPFDYYSDGLSANVPQTDMTDDDIDDMESMTEYRVEAKVMGKPVSQQAVTVGKRTAHVSDDEVFGKNSRAAKSLLSVMKNIGNGGAEKVSKKVERNIAPSACMSPDGRAYQAPLVEPLFPEVTKFETNRLPEYIGPLPHQPQQQQPPVEYQKNPAYVPLADYRHQEPPVAPPRGRKISQEAKSVPTYFPQERPNIYQKPQREVPSTLPLQAGPISPPSYNYNSPSKTPESTPYTAQIITDGMYMQTVPSVRPPYSGPSTPNDYPSYQSRTYPSQYNNPTPKGYPGPQPVVNLPQIPLETSFTKVYDKPRDIAPYYPTSPNYSNVPSQAIYPPAETQKSPKIQQSPKPAFVPEQYYQSPKVEPAFAPQPTYQPRTEVSPQYYPSPKVQQSPQSPPFAPQPTYQPRTEVSPQYYPSPKIQQSPQSPPFVQQPTYQSPKAQQRPQSPVFVQQHTYQTRNEVPTQYNQSPKVQQRPQSPVFVQQSIYQPRNEEPHQYNQSPRVQQRPQSPVFVQQPTNQLRNEVPSQYNQSPKVQQRPQSPVFAPQKASQPKTEVPASYNRSPKVQQNSQTPEVPVQQYQSPKVQQPTQFIPNTEAPTQYYQSPKTQQSPQPRAPMIQQTSKPVHQSKPKVPPKSETVVQSSKFHQTSSTYRQQQSEKTVVPASLVKQPIPTNTAVLCKQASLDGRKRVQSQSQLYEQVEEVRRKSLGNVLEITRLEREAQDQKAAAIKQDMYSVQQDVYSQKVKTKQRTEIHQQETKVYKSSAPDDTPDIVKSSLAKDDIPILKKFGPPQRHCYIPNAYQNPLMKSETTVAPKPSQPAPRKFSEPSINRGPVIVETPSTPQPDGQDEIPRNIVFNNISAFTSMSRRYELSTTTTEKTETKDEDGGVVTTTTKVTTRTITGAPKPVSPFAKFQQLDKQNSLQSPKSPLTPTTPGGSSSTPIFRFTDPALNARAATVKEQLLQWCQSKTQEYENVQITNFSASWTDGLAFCALIHHFLPDAFDYSKLNPKQRRYNFELAFRVADEKAGIAPLLDVEDMVVMKRPDWKCVFTYVQSIYRRFRNCQ